MSEFTGKIFDENVEIPDVGEEHENVIISENANVFYRMVWDAYLKIPTAGIQLTEKGREKIKLVCDLVEKVFGEYGLEVVKLITNKRMKTANLTVSFDCLTTDETSMVNLQKLVKYVDSFDLTAKTDTLKIELSLDMYGVCE